MPRTVARLADGREIIYFDEHDGADREAVDTRELPALEASSEIRYDVVLGEWVAIASHRQWRTHLPPVDGCPLCPSTVERPTEIPSGDYAVVVFENRFPAFAGEDRDLAWLHLELFSVRRAPGRLKHLAGSEAGMGVFLNDIAPESAAEALRLTTRVATATGG